MLLLFFFQKKIVPKFSDQLCFVVAMVVNGDPLDSRPRLSLLEGIGHPETKPSPVDEVGGGFLRGFARCFPDL